MTKDVNHRDENGMTPLLYAIFAGDLGHVRQLLADGADPNLPG
jgi:ankyrin repeat protein